MGDGSQRQGDDQGDNHVAMCGVQLKVDIGREVKRLFVVVHVHHKQ